MKNVNVTTDRQNEIEAFLASAGLSDQPRTPIAGDASNRRYERILKPGAPVILMDAPAVRGEDIRPFIRIARYLRGIGLSAPEIIAEDADAGLLLLEDLGDDLYARLLSRDSQLEDTLYTAATDVLIELHRHAPPDVADYTTERMTTLAGLAFDWYRYGITGEQDDRIRTDSLDILADAIATHAAGPRTLALRDFHAENLIWLPDRHGAARVGLLDFQDAMLAHPAYDLVSVLRDARRDVGAGIEDKMIARYCEIGSVQPETFRMGYSITGVQRQLRILGVFARLSLAYGKSRYIDYIPRVWSDMIALLDRSELPELKRAICDALPPPTQDRLRTLKEKCGTFPIAS